MRILSPSLSRAQIVELYFSPVDTGVVSCGEQR